MRAGEMEFLRGLSSSLRIDPVDNSDCARHLAEGMEIAAERLDSTLNTIERMSND